MLSPCAPASALLGALAVGQLAAEALHGASLEALQELAAAEAGTSLLAGLVAAEASGRAALAAEEGAERLPLAMGSQAAVVAALRSAEGEVERLSAELAGQCHAANGASKVSS